jgi:PAS domain S-box-containing protein
LANEPEQLARLDKMHPLALAHLDRLTKAVEQADRGGQPDSTTCFRAETGKHEKAEMDECLTAILSSARERLRAHGEISLRLGNMAGTAITLGGMLALGVLTWAGLFVLKDIKARQRAEEILESEHNLLRRVIDSIPEQVTVRDAEGRCIVENDVHLKTPGFDQQEEGGSAEAGENRVVIETGRPFLKERAVCEPDGKTKWFSVKKVPFLDREGKTVGTVSFTSDISAHKEAEEALRVTASQLRTRNAELHEFAAAASHDLQEPLRKILAFGDRLHSKCHDALGEDGRDYLDRITNAARRMQSLVEGLLSLARMSQRATHWEKVDLKMLVGEVLSDLEIRIEQSGARVDAGDLPTIEADALQMRQLFQNLIANALKFCKPAAAPWVKIRARRLGQDEVFAAGFLSNEEAWQIEFEDNGIGFDGKFAERIFDPFIRLHGRNVYEGAGIGLALVRKIVERHAGGVRAVGSEGCGAKFIVTLPAKQPNKDQNEQTR